jgi:hypothetical protein
MKGKKKTVCASAIFTLLLYAADGLRSQVDVDLSGFPAGVADER